MSVSGRLNTRGATLPLTILLLSLMGVAVAIGYTRVASERRITGDGKAQLGAFAVAQSGLNRFLANINGKPAGMMRRRSSSESVPKLAWQCIRQVRGRTVLTSSITRSPRPRVRGSSSASSPFRRSRVPPRSWPTSAGVGRYFCLPW